MKVESRVPDAQPRPRYSRGVYQPVPTDVGRSGAKKGLTIAARVLATPTRFRAHSAVLHAHRAVAFALLGAAAARFRAGSDQSPDDRWLRFGLARDDVSRRSADIGAVQREADATPEIGDRCLREARIGACGARLAAVEKGIDQLPQPAPAVD
jgi:hypothetical protein